MSVKAFLKNEQKKRLKDAAPAAPPADTPVPVLAPATEPMVNGVNSISSARDDTEVLDRESNAEGGLNTEAIDAPPEAEVCTFHH